VPHPFLSDEWIAEARAIREKYAGEGTPFPFQVKMNQVITDVPFGDGKVNLFLDTSSGHLVLEKGELTDAEVTVTTDYATARQILVDQDSQAAMQAFMAGKIKVQGDMMKLMQLQAAPPSDTAQKVGEEIKAITE
jgi:putative sterol carrier protein